MNRLMVWAVIIILYSAWLPSLTHLMAWPGVSGNAGNSVFSGPLYESTQSSSWSNGSTSRWYTWLLFF